MKKPTTITKSVVKNVAPGVSRTIIPLSYNTTDPNGFNKWQEHIRFENYVATGLPLALTIQQRLELVKSA